MVQITGAPSVDYALAAMILAAASITHPDYVPTQYQTFLLTVFIMIIHGCISSMPTLWIARFNSVGSTLNMIGLFIVIVCQILSRKFYAKLRAVMRTATEAGHTFFRLSKRLSAFVALLNYDVFALC